MAISFQAALDMSKQYNRAVLLGNGFSIACNEIFNYRSLLENSNTENNIRGVFKKLETADYEVIIEKLESAAQLIDMYTSDYNELIDLLKNSSKNLKNEFARVISNRHVDYATAFRKINPNNEIREQDCFNFLHNFSKIYTTNYDLLLYWSIMRYLERRRRNSNDSYNQNQDDEIVIVTNDGFTRVGEDQPLRYVGGPDQRIFYLHGSLLLLQDGFDILKIERNDQEGLNLLPIISNNIGNNEILPLIVLEGNSSNKLSKISEHLYLTDALTNLSTLDGALFIHGHSLDQSDQHIFDAINKSSLTQVFISVVDSVEIQDMEKKAISRLGNKRDRQIYLYDALSASVWS